VSNDIVDIALLMLRHVDAHYLCLAIVLRFSCVFTVSVFS